MEENNNRTEHAPADQPEAEEANGMTNPEGQETQSEPRAHETPFNPVPGTNDVKNTMGLAGMWCGIAAIVTLFIPVVQLFAPFILGILAIVFGVKGRKQSKSGAALAGIIIGIVALVFFVIFMILVIVGIAFIASDPMLLDELDIE